jgi:predicted nuclease with TOPRIM domain
MENISSLLPEGLTEDTVVEIANIIDTVISEEVDGKVRDLENKVQSFMRLKIDEMKRVAITELESENETFKNAKIFEGLKALMALELNEQDEDTAVSHAKKEIAEIQEENDVLVSELNNSLKECAKLENTLKVVSDKVRFLEEDNCQLQENVSILEEANAMPFESNERAIVISENVDSEPENSVDELSQAGNEFITEDMMAYMPFNTRN